MTNPFDGPGQLGAIAVLIAVIAYLRNVPMKDIRDFVNQEAEWDADDARKLKFYRSCWWGHVKYILHSIGQIVLMFVAYLLTLRIRASVIGSHAGIPEDARGFVFHLDEWIATLAVAIAVVYLAVHLILDGMEIVDSFLKLSKRGKQISELRLRNNTSASGP